MCGAEGGNYHHFYLPSIFYNDLWHTLKCKGLNGIKYLLKDPNVSAFHFRIKNVGREDSLLGQATCNSRVGPLMSSEKDFVGGGGNKSYYNPLRVKSQSWKRRFFEVEAIF